MIEKLNKSKILIIDDDETITIALSKYLNLKYDLFVLNSSKDDYLKILEENNISLILLDVQIPHKNGFEVAKEIKSIESYKDIPIIFITVSVDNETIVQAFKNHASDYIRKPFNKEELIARIDVHLNNYENLKKIKKQQDIIYTQARNTTMKDMLVKISHHWRQPLSVISLCAQSLEIENQFGDLNKEIITKSTSEIINTTNKLSENINFFSELYINKSQTKLLDLTLETSKLIQSIKTIFYDDHLDIETLNNFIDKKIERNINIINIKNALLNIISNSIDSYNKNRINKRYIKIETYFLNEIYEITVTDYAGGVNEDIINKIFEPYYSTKTDLNGKGLGLYICKNIIENQYNGTILVKNVKDKENLGFEVKIKIPL